MAMKANMLACGSKFAGAVAVLAALAAGPAQPAQQARAEMPLTLAQAERNAADLHRGMSPEDVRKLLGKPRRTGLKDDGVSGATSQGALRWTYVWTGGSGPGTLNVDFVADAPEQWQVRGWEWSSY
jgi:hypothetical protein